MSGGARSVIGTSLKGIALIAVVAAGVTLVRLPLYIKDLAVQGGAALTSAQHIEGPLLGARITLLVIGVAMMAVFIFHFASRPAEKRNDKLLLAITWTAFALAIVSEIIGRGLFYESMVRVGM